MPSLSSSRHSAGQPTAAASRWAGVVFPDPAGPLTTINVGRLMSSLPAPTRQLWPPPTPPPMRRLTPGTADQATFEYSHVLVGAVHEWLFGRL